MKSVLTTSNNILFNSEPNILLGFTNTDYQARTYESEKPVMVTTTDEVHLRCDGVVDSIVISIREQILFSFNSSASLRYKIIKERNIVVYKKVNKTRLDKIQFFLEDSNNNPLDFNNDTLTFTIQSIKIYTNYLVSFKQMSFNKFKIESYCVVGKHYSATTNIRRDIIQNQKLE